jgi:hypothetical protein
VTFDFFNLVSWLIGFDLVFVVEADITDLRRNTMSNKMISRKKSEFTREL